MEKDLLKIKELLFQYINIILKEYPNSNRKNIIDKINNGEEIVKFNETNTISFFVKDNVLLLPKVVYSIFPLLKKYPNYGTKLNQCRSSKDYLDTNTTYVEYINHVIEGALTIYDYFLESLLHEAMHICGSRGASPLEEGINELKTRELAMKYNIKIAAYGYYKEVEIAKRLQNLIGKEVMDDLTFVEIDRRLDFLSMRVGLELAKLYELVSIKMREKSKEYFDNMAFISDPLKKAQLYDEIDYSDILIIIDNYSKKINRM